MAVPKRAVSLEFTVHDRLRKAREFAGLSQDQLAEAIGVDRGTISNYETGATTRLKRIIIGQWALKCGVPLDYIKSGYAPRDSNPKPSEQVRSRRKNVA